MKLQYDSGPLHIQTDRDTVTMTGLPYGEHVEWVKGTHTAYVHSGSGRIVDAFSFSWEKNSPTMLDFTESLHTWLDYYWEEWELASW